MGTAPPHLQLATWLRSTEMLKLVVASMPLDVNVEVTVNGVKIPINLDKAENSGQGRQGCSFCCDEYCSPLFQWYKKSEENSKTNRQGEFTDWYKKTKGNPEGEEAQKSGMYIGLY